MGLVKSRLRVMMILQYSVWGVWMPILARYLQAPVEEGGLGFTVFQLGMIMGTAGSIGAITAPFIAGQLADRYFSAERSMAVLLVLGGIVIFIMAGQTSFTAWVVLASLYSILYMPTLALSNSISFANLDKPEVEFPLVRVFGGIGWIAASWAFPMYWLQSDLTLQAMPPFFAGTEVTDATGRLADALRISGVVSILYAGCCFMLPHTPPKRDDVEPLAFKKAFALLRHPSFAWLVAASLPIAVIHQIYFVQTAPFFSQVLGIEDRYIGPAMTVGQFAELIIMACLGLMLRGWGFRTTICIGGTAYVLRYAIFGMAESLPVELVIASQALHGFCYACFFAAAYIYVDRIASADVRSSAQTVFGIVILGVGPMITSVVLGVLGRVFPDGDGGIVFSSLWFTLSAVALVTTVAFGAFFRDETQGQATGDEGISEEVAES